MPTIDQLAPATAASDDDEIAVSQGGVVRRVTRSQLVAGLQPMLALPQGTILGRASLGPGGAEIVSVGANLSLTNGTLSASSGFEVTNLPTGTVPSAANLVPVAQAGTAGAVPYAQFMMGLANLSGIDASAMEVRSAGQLLRPLVQALGDAVSIEQFGAVGDGVSDDTNAFTAAVASGYPLLLGPRVYMISGQWTVTQAAVLIGVPGQTIIRRNQQTGNGAWILFEGASVRADGIIFDANGETIQTESWGVLVCTPQSWFRSCVFSNACGTTLGSGLTLQANTASTSEHSIVSCDASGNAAHGIWAQAVTHLQISGCFAHDNGGYGIVVDYTDPSFQSVASFVQVHGNQAFANQRGISIGNYNATNTQPPVWGLANPDVISAIVANNICHGNRSYGIAVSGRNLAVVGNNLFANGTVATGGSGVLANVSSTLIASNMIAGPGQFGIDSGGSSDIDIIANHVSGFAVGLNAGGSQNVRIASNLLVSNQWGITIYNVETDGSGGSFGLFANQIAIEANSITFSSSACGGIYLIDAPQSVIVRGNAFAGSADAQISQALWPYTDSAVIDSNIWNGRSVQNVSATSTGSGAILFADAMSQIAASGAGAPITSVQSAVQAQTSGQVVFIKLLSGGGGYTVATVTISGAGSGASAIAHVYQGAVVGIAMTANGSGYGPVGTSVDVVIVGDGAGAQAAAVAGLPLVEGRDLRVMAATSLTFAFSGSLPQQINWTGNDVQVQAMSSLNFRATQGAWFVDGFPPSNYLVPRPNGALALQSPLGGDLQLYPHGQGQLRYLTDLESVGCVSCIGRGSPEGLVTAPPGSDFRNLNGGVGSTYWVKQTGTGPSGWQAIA